jgi:hypothetical protein
MFWYAHTALLQAFVCGRAASGLSCILVRVITKATLPDSPAGLRQSTLIFLGAASLIVMGCTVVASWLPAHAPGETLVHVVHPAWAMWFGCLA